VNRCHVKKSGYTPIHAAAEHGHEQVVRKLLYAENFDVNALTRDGSIKSFLVSLLAFTNKIYRPKSKITKSEAEIFQIH